MTLLLDGIQIRGHRLKVTGNLRIESDDMSGQTSNTDSADKGFKPKTLTVALMIKYKDSAILANPLPMNLRHVDMRAVLAEVSRQTGL